MTSMAPAQKAAPELIDLRSDTVTRPTPSMRRAMAEAEVGDGVFREDPTVRRLEESAAARLGKEAALFVPTGTMGNQKGVHRRGTRVRKRLGGGMRQAGVLAAAGLVALQENIERLAEDHENARRLAEGIAGIPG